MQEIPYPYAPQYFSAIGISLMLTSVGCVLYNPSGSEWNTLFVFSILSIFISIAFQFVNFDAAHLNYHN